MRAAGRLRQPQTASNMHTKLYRLGALTQSAVHARPAQQLGRVIGPVPAVTQVCQPGALSEAANSRTRRLIGYSHPRTWQSASLTADTSAAAAKGRTLRQREPILAGLISTASDSHASLAGSSSSSMTLQRPGGLSNRRISQLSALQSFLGYNFRDLTLLDQACTHDPTGAQPSYRELAFVGDAALWLLFCEHAFKTYGSTEDPISGGWPAQLSQLLSRANCAATARQWGLGAFLQHSMPQHDTPNGECVLPTLQHSTPQHDTPHLRAATTHMQQQDKLLLLQRVAPKQQQLLSQEAQGSTTADWMMLGSESTLQEDGSSSSSSGGTGVLSRSSSTDSVSSSSSSSDRGMYAGVWTSDTLAEMFEGVVGALLLDCGSDYDTLQQLLLPWVASSLDASKQAAAAAAPASVSAAGAVLPASIACVEDLQQVWLQDLHTALEEQLQQQYGVYFGSPAPLAGASQHMLQVLKTGQTCADADTMKFLGFGILQFAAALQAYRGQHEIGRESVASGGLCRWPLLGQVLLPQGREGWHADCSSSSSSSSSSQVGKVCRKGQVVHQMSKHAARLTTVRHRAKMWLLLLEGTPWCPADSYLVTGNWKKQKQVLARCLDLLLAAVYLDSGLEAAAGLAAALIYNTPPTTHDKSWMPAWARQN